MARETPPGADERASERADRRDGEMEVIRERLDGSSLPGWRAAVAGWLERIGVWLGADSTPTPSSARAGVTSTALGPPAWERRLTTRQKLARGAMAALAVALALFALLNGPAATRGALSALDAALHPPRPIPTISASDYTLKQLPVSAQHLPRIALAPGIAPPGMAFACWVNPYRNAPADQRGLAVVYQTSDFARTWRRLPLPAVVGQDCGVVTDTAGSAGALVIVWPGYTTGGFCLTPKLFYTTNGGATWATVPWAERGVLSPCGVRFAVDGNAIFAWSTQPLMSGALPSHATARLIVTHDNGATWAAADAGLNDDSGLALVGFRPGGRILATIPDVSGPPGAAKLMESSDYGASWRDISELPGAFPLVYASTDPGVAYGGGWGRLYVVARPRISGGPADALHVVLATTLDSRWTPIPLPPLAAVDNSGVESALPAVVGVGPAESLLVERGAVPTNSEGRLSPARRLWAWSASQGRWLLDPQPSLGNADLLGWSWSHGDQTIWVTSLQLGVPPTLLLFTKTYMVASIGSTR